ncbi:MAG: prepilin-type N-terminal cleavage/methylation domain-containing protein [Candidatus Shapirobacteria bacterium]|nr:prepilin-type N-terminal cleavage/methylation domain-containing protein [Candidatus Shapirobacteria bacterium]MDD4410389.1 prepilin-type N-terminal cleavage/methylation domain-containing protein [Candidatus Shapirobacteria bacterium]
MKKGFTLIEILIVVGVVMVIMVSISGIMSGVFTSQNKNKSSDAVTQNGSWILNELKKNVLNADSNGQNFVCNGNSILITSIKDKETTLISCVENNNIASFSAKRNSTINLINNNELRLTGCGNFVNCTTLPNGQLSKVTFNFSLGAGVAGLTSETNKNFSIDVTLRN